MQNAGQQYGQGAASSHQGTPYGHTDSSSSSSGSITSSLRQFRKKDVDKQQVSDPNAPATESHVARVAPHNHYPPRTNENYRYPSQFPDYSLSPQVKYSEISELHPMQDQVSPSVIQKAKGKEYMDMCNVQQNHMKPTYPDHLNQQFHAPESNLHPHAQYPQKETQVHPLYKPESQYFPKESQYQQLPHQIQKYNMPAQIRKYPPENDFLSKLRRIHPSMARSIMSDHHLQESQPSYQAMDQSRMYPHQNQRYINYPSSMQNNPYPHNYMSHQNYTNYPASCSYTRPPPQMGPRFPSINPHERSISPRRGYSENLPIPPMSYGSLPQKISPNYPQYNAPEYAQHYQHRRAPAQDYYQQHCRTAQYLPHQMTPQEMSENRVTVSDSIKQYIENWADEETASEMNQIENNRLCKENLRVRDEQSTETVYMINASELQYLENGIPLVTSENGIPLVTSENGQYIIKSGVSIDNSTAMVRIMEKTNQIGSEDTNGERVVNLHIMDTFKPDCMLASKSTELNQRQDENTYSTSDKPKVVIHQNTVIQPSQQNTVKENVEEAEANKVGNSLPIITDGDLSQEADALEKFDENIFKECKKEMADKNCSPINVEQMEGFEEYNEAGQKSVICATKALEQTDDVKPNEEQFDNIDESKVQNMPAIDILSEDKFKNEDENAMKMETDLTNENKIECRMEEDKFIPDDNDHFENIKSITEHQTEGSSVAGEKINVNQISANETKEAVNPPENTEQPTPDCHISEFDTVKEETTDNDSQVVAGNSETTINESVEQEEDALKEEIAETTNTTVVQKEPSSEDTKGTCKSEETNGEKSGKPQRVRRIFSVDDIINNIGTNTNKSKADKELTERRRSLQSTREFLEREVDYSQMFVLKRNTISEMKNDKCLSQEENEETDEKTKISDKQPVKEETREVRESCIEQTKSCELQIEDKEKKSEEIHVNCTENPSDLKNITVDDKVAKNNIENSMENCKEHTIGEPTNTQLSDIPQLAEDVSNDEKLLEKGSTNDGESEVTSVANFKQGDEENGNQNEVHYRNAIRVEENSVLLEIAGELVEINVATVMGKKIITVVPLSETTVVDFNDNYETLENAESVDELTKTETIEANRDDETTGLISVEEVVPETEVIETTSEIIIGMDISLEEEIQLDLEKPPVLCTKASKKAYENDLQIPSITTSEDVNDNNNRDSYSVNDKVSSSKEQPIEKSGKKRDKIIDSSKQFLDSKRSESDKKALRELLKVRKIKKDRVPKLVEEEEFVPFKDLVKARNLKKLKLQQLKINENVSADSTNKIDHEETSESGSDTKAKIDTKEKRKTEEDVPSRSKSVGGKETDFKTKERKPKSYRKSSKSEEDSPEKNKLVTEKLLSPPKADAKINSSTTEKVVESPKEKVAKKVTFGTVDYRTPEDYIEKIQPEIRHHKFQDPRLKPRSNSEVIVPSVSEILKENAGVENCKRKLSLEEYIKRKRKLSTNSNQDEREVKLKKISEEKSGDENKIAGDKSSTQKRPVVEKLQRPKSLDDLDVSAKPKDSILRRKFSLEDTYFRPNYFDWEETQSPKINLSSQERSEKRLSEFSGLINNNKSKIVIDINDLKTKPRVSESSEDDILQIYKEQVDSKLNSLNIQIPRTAKPQNPILNPETNNLMERFLKNEKITYEEMEKIKKIISYKRLMQQLNKIKPPDLEASPLSPTYEIRKNCTEKDIKLHLKKVPDKKGKKRFRNLYSDSTSDSDSDFSEGKEAGSGDYSVVQSNCYAAGVPKLIIKRKTELPVPVVRLERLDLGTLGKKRKTY